MDVPARCPGPIDDRGGHSPVQPHRHGRGATPWGVVGARPALPAFGRVPVVPGVRFGVIATNGSSRRAARLPVRASGHVPGAEVPMRGSLGGSVLGAYERRAAANAATDRVGRPGVPEGNGPDNGIPRAFKVDGPIGAMPR